MAKKKVKLNQDPHPNQLWSPELWQPYLVFCDLLQSQVLIGSLTIITQVIRIFYCRQFPVYKQYFADYKPVTYYQRDGLGTRFRVLPILYSTFYIMRKVLKPNQIKKNKSSTSIKQYLLFHRQILNVSCSFFVALKKPQQYRALFDDWLQSVYYTDEKLSVMKMFPWQLLVRGIVRQKQHERSLVSMKMAVTQQIDLNQIAKQLFQEQIMKQQRRVDRVMLADTLNTQQLKRNGLEMRRHPGWEDIKTGLGGLTSDLRNLMFFLRDFMYSCVVLNYRSQKMSQTALNSAFQVSISAQTKYEKQSSFIWVNIPAHALYNCKSQEQLQQFCLNVLFTFLHKLAIHSNYYGLQLQFNQDKQIITLLRANCMMRTRPIWTDFYFEKIIDSFNDLQRGIFYTGGSKHFKQDNVYVVGSFYLYDSPQQDCFQILVQNVIKFKFLTLGPLQKERLKVLKDPFVVSELCSIPIICTAAQQFSNVNVNRLKPNQQFNPDAWYCILISLGHAQLAKMTYKKEKETKQYIWQPLNECEAKELQNKIKSQNQIIEAYQKFLRKQMVDSGPLKLINQFSRRFFTGIGFVDIQTLVVNNVIQSQHNIIYLACLVYWCSQAECFVEQIFSWTQHKQQLPLNLVRRMLAIAKKFTTSKDISGKTSYIWQTFNGMQFDYYILHQYLMKSLLCLGTFGQRVVSKGYYTDQIKFFDMRKILNRGSLKMLTQRQFYAKKDLDIVAITTINEYNQNKEAIDQYCIYDCRALMQLTFNHYSMFMQVLLTLLKKFRIKDRYYQFISKPRNLLSSFTASSQSMYILKNIFFPQGLKRLSSIQTIQSMRKFVFGGMVQVLRHFNQPQQKVYQLDVIGMYAAIMKKTLPYQQVYRKPFQQISRGQLRILNMTLDEIFQQARQQKLIFFFVLKNIQLLTDYPFIPVRLANGGLVYPKQIQQCIIPDQQLKFLLDQGLLRLQPQQIVEIQCYTTQLTDRQSKEKSLQTPIQTCVQELIKLRQQYKNKMKEQPEVIQHSLKSDFCKLQINSISGKFMMRYFPSSLMTHQQFQLYRMPPKQSNDLQDIFNSHQQDYQEIKQGSNMKMIYDYSRQNDPYIGDLVHIGAFITSQGRFQIFKAIRALQKVGLMAFYTDTDSIFVSKIALDFLISKGFVGKDFGDLQNKDQPFDYATFMNRKCYILLQKLPKVFQSRTLSQFSKFTLKQQLEFVQKHLKYKFDKVQIERFHRISPMTAYVIKHHTKIGFKGFSIIPHWTQLCAIQYSFIITYNVARRLYLQPHKQNTLPIVSRQYLQVLMADKHLYCNRLHIYREKLQNCTDRYIQMTQGLKKKQIKMLSQQKTTMVTKNSQHNSVNFMTILKVLNLNAKRVITEQRNETKPYDCKQQFQK